MQLAVALYNNPVDDDDELEFRKGDILTVLIENPHGLEGWWLCQHQGKFGLCPGNRLKLISSRINSATTKCNNFPSRISSASVNSLIRFGSNVKRNINLTLLHRYTMLFQVITTTIMRNEQVFKRNIDRRIWIFLLPLVFIKSEKKISTNRLLNSQFHRRLTHRDFHRPSIFN